MGDVVDLPRRDGVGVDRLSVSFPIGGYDRSAFPTVTTVTGVDGKVSRSTSGTVWSARDGQARVFLGVAQLPNGAVVGKVESNPSRFADPDGCSLLPPHQLPAALAVMVEAAATVMDLRISGPGDVRVKRLDVARDFRGVAAPSWTIGGLQRIRRPHARRSFVYHDPARHGAQTLWAGSGSGGVRLYDQHAAYADRGAPEGSLRWEVEARGDWLARHGIVTGRDLTSGAVEALALHRWEWSRMGTEVTGAANVVDAIDRLICRHPRGERGRRDCGCDGLTVAKARRLLGDLVAESLGVGWSSAKASTAEYEAFKRRLGVVPSAELFAGADVSVSARLDFATGYEVAA